MPQATLAENDDSATGFSFPAIGRKKVTAAFDGGRLTSDGRRVAAGAEARAIKVVDICIADLDRGEITALEMVEQLLEELMFRENRCIRTALRMGGLNSVKTLTGYDFSFQPDMLRHPVCMAPETVG